MEQLKKFFLTNINSKQIILKNTFWLYLSEAISKGTKLLIFILIVRILGPQQFGVFEYLFSFVGMLFLFADFGSSSIFIRDYQQKEEKEKYTNTFLSLKILLSILFGLLSIVGFLFVKKELANFFLYLPFVIFYILMNIEGFFEAYFMAIQRVEKKFFFNFISSLILLILIVFGLNIYRSINMVIVAYLISAICSLATAYFLLNKSTKISFLLDKNLIFYYIYRGLPLALFGLLGYIFFSTDKIILAYLRPIDEVGYYSLASRIISVILVIPSLLNAALYPYLAKKAVEKEGESKIFKLSQIMISISIFLALFIAFIAFLSAEFLVLMFFGEKYLPTISIFKIFIWIIIFIYPTIFLDYLLVSYHKEWLDFGVTLIPAIFNIIFNFILIPYYGVYGAVYASIMAQFLNFVLTFFVSWLVLKNKNQ